MIPYVDDCYFYGRNNNIIIANLTNGDQIPLVRLKQKFPDIVILDKQHLSYMIAYMAMHPNLWELIEKEKQEQQLTLF